MARKALQCARKRYSPHFKMAVMQNTRNLELKRWRDALCLVMREEVEAKGKDDKDIGQVCDSFIALESMSAFPIEWFTSEYLQDTWPVVFARINKVIHTHSKSEFDKETESHLSGQSLEGFLTTSYQFLAKCLLERKDVSYVS
jgi:hypothetical protein